MLGSRGQNRFHKRDVQMTRPQEQSTIAVSHFSRSGLMRIMGTLVMGSGSV